MIFKLIVLVFIVFIIFLLKILDLKDRRVSDISVSRKKINNEEVVYLEPKLEQVEEIESVTEQANVSYGVFVKVMSGFEKQPAKIKSKKYSRFYLIHTNIKGEEIRFVSPLINTDSVTLKFILSSIKLFKVSFDRKNPVEYKIEMDTLFERLS